MRLKAKFKIILTWFIYFILLKGCVTLTTQSMIEKKKLPFIREDFFLDPGVEWLPQFIESSILTL